MRQAVAWGRARGLLDIRFVSSSDVGNLRSIPIDTLVGIVIPIGNYYFKRYYLILLYYYIVFLIFIKNI